jgi:hypothetical protein
MKKQFLKFLKKLDTLLKENENQYGWSSNRLAFILTATISNLIIWGMILFLTIKNQEFPVIDTNIVWIYAVANSITSASKVLQKKFENSENTEEK